eukprot:Phypoly_transcript_19396.p1 GENE.Phypoly_transcript_19396~~Phypoly_transcript_19396.p1  ORF type:complete len:191 (+),score=15.89 Phypoly_transcript_19396:62-634(+)
MMFIPGMQQPGEDYFPIKAGSIDGTDTNPHDRGIKRADLCAELGLYDPFADPKIKGEPSCTLMVARLNLQTDEATLDRVFNKWGKIRRLRLVRDIVTGMSRGYAFIEYYNEHDMRDAFRLAHRMVIDGATVMVEFERERCMPGWVPRRYGGGIGGKKESGQIRFGGRDRPFKKPFSVPRTPGNRPRFTTR